MFMKLLFFGALAAFTIAAFGCGASSIATTNDDVASLTLRTAEANKALVRGDIDKYIALTNHAQDYSLMTPFGGAPQFGFDGSTEHRQEMAKFFRSGSLDQEVVATYNSGDLVVLVTIERIRAQIDGLPEQDWSLRVTQVYQRVSNEWRLQHRHADPLGNRITLEQAAALARGKKEL
jgi:ketosteroid isomerase-like protein